MGHFKKWILWRLWTWKKHRFFWEQQKKIIWKWLIDFDGNENCEDEGGWGRGSFILIENGLDAIDSKEGFKGYQSEIYTFEIFNQFKYCFIICMVIHTRTAGRKEAARWYFASKAHIVSALVLFRIELMKIQSRLHVYHVYIDWNFIIIKIEFHCVHECRSLRFQWAVNEIAFRQKSFEVGKKCLVIARNSLEIEMKPLRVFEITSVP